MSPIDDELRNLLHARADVLAPAPDPLGGIERRARRMRRNRVAASVAGAALAVSAVAVAVPLLRPGTDNGATQFASQQPSLSGPQPSSTSQAALPATALDPQHPWAYRGDPAVIAGNELTTLRSEWTTKHPGTTLAPLFGHVYEPSAQTEIVFVSTGDTNRWGVATSSEGGWSFLVDEPLAPAATVLMTALPGDEVQRLLILAGPTTGQISYAADGTTFRDYPGVDVGVVFVPLEGDTSRAVVRVLDGDGDLDNPVFLGRIPTATGSGDVPSPSPSPDATQPAEVTSAPTMAARLAFDPAHPWAYRGAAQDGTGDIVSADNKQFMSTYPQSAGEQDTVLYAVHLSATTDVAVVLHARTDGDYVSFTAHDGNGTHQVAYQPATGEDILSAYVPLDAQHGLLIGVVSDQAGNVVLQTGDRAEVGGSRTAGIWDWTPKADPQARLAAFAKGDGEPYSSQPAT
jgi:hypothetical protein